MKTYNRLNVNSTESSPGGQIQCIAHYECYDKCPLDLYTNCTLQTDTVHDEDFKKTEVIAIKENAIISRTLLWEKNKEQCCNTENHNIVHRSTGVLD